jgi:acyl-homoserine lactone acylase PvdQ
MKFSILILLLFIYTPLIAQPPSKEELLRWERQAEQVTITRDRWGIPHIQGKSDADAVFGLLFAQCEDDFQRIELNYIEKLGRLSEIEGTSKVYDDLLIRILIDHSEAQADYKRAPKWLKKLLIAYADGINYYLYKHPEVTPLLIKRFEPWFPLLWTDGSIGAINTDAFSSEDLRQQFEPNMKTSSIPSKEDTEILTGSNGFAIAPEKTVDGKTILYINPHVTFFFRPEVHMTSETGLNTYGAVTWGQFFVYQGFNEHCGWMHTSSFADVADTYEEQVMLKNGKWYYEYNQKWLPVEERKITLKVVSNDSLAERNFTIHSTHHGPVFVKKGFKWYTLKSTNRSIDGLVQSWRRTKARNLKEFKKTMEIRANTSNNTVYADKYGNIAYWHGNFHPVRDSLLDWSKPVAGNTSSTEWKGIHPLEKTIHLINPSNGWLQNCNSTPFTAAGINSPKPSDFPSYMAPDGENFRGLNAAQLLQANKRWNLDQVIEIGYNRRMAAFELLIPTLIRTYEQSPASYKPFAAPIELLKTWDYHCDETSIATTLAVEWGQNLLAEIRKCQVPGQPNADFVKKTQYFAETAQSMILMKSLADVLNSLNDKFGTWEVPWGEINRFQRLTGEVKSKFSDEKPSLAVGFTSSLWGTLPSYSSRYTEGCKKRYGVNGNSFVCAVEFGEKIRAKSVLAGGNNSDPASTHFFDQGEMYTKGKFKEVLFYQDELEQNMERKYHPGQ